MRGRVDLIINGSYWLGAAFGALGAYVLLMDIFPVDLGWRLAFGLGAILGVGILLVRRHVPESPRWLFIHGREEEAERIVDDIEREISEETHEPLDEPGSSITVRQRRTISLREVATTAFKTYPKRSFLGLALFVGQAFIYNAVTFGLGTFLVEFYDVKDGIVPLYLALFAVSNFLGPLLLGHLFDTVGRKPMITGTYIGSALVLAVLTMLFVGDSLGKWGFMALLLATFFLASAGASSAYLTVSEIFPMETRALAIAFFYAIGTAIGGITGPYLFGKMIESGEESQVAIAFFLGAAVMALGGVAELFFGVKAEQAELEDIAKPLTAQDAEQDKRPDEEVAARPDRRAAAATSARSVRRPPRAGPPLPARPGPRAAPRPACPCPRRSPSRSSPARCSGSSRRWPSTARPSGASSRGSSARASGARAGSRRRCARRCSAAARGGSTARTSAPAERQPAALSASRSDRR